MAMQPEFLTEALLKLSELGNEFTILSAMQTVGDAFTVEALEAAGMLKRVGDKEVITKVAKSLIEYEKGRH